MNKLRVALVVLLVAGCASFIEARIVRKIDPISRTTRYVEEPDPKPVRGDKGYKKFVSQALFNDAANVKSGDIQKLIRDRINAGAYPYYKDRSDNPEISGLSIRDYAVKCKNQPFVDAFDKVTDEFDIYSKENYTDGIQIGQNGFNLAKSHDLFNAALNNNVDEGYIRGLISQGANPNYRDHNPSNSFDGQSVREYAKQHNQIDFVNTLDRVSNEFSYPNNENYIDTRTKIGPNYKDQASKDFFNLSWDGVKRTDDELRVIMKRKIEQDQADPDYVDTGAQDDKRGHSIRSYAAYKGNGQFCAIFDEVRDLYKK